MSLALDINQCGGRVVAISVVQVLKGDGERGDVNMVMSVMCKKINEVGNDRPERERWQISGELAIANLDFFDGIKN